MASPISAAVAVVGRPLTAASIAPSASSGSRKKSPASRKPVMRPSC
jgi:hypothetical protein